MSDVARTLIGNSAPIEKINEEIARAARTSAKIMITGETGVGKEVVARLIHENSARRARRLVTVNCSGIPDTLLESELFGHTKGSFTGAFRDKPGLVRVADGGTLFLDELGEMSMRMQASLLRFTETGEVQPIGADGPISRSDVRLITATHRDLGEQIRCGTFRRDLYYRLNVVHIHVPALRERGDDVRLLLLHFFRHTSELHRCEAPQLSPEVERLLCAYSWPGNVRELKNVVERLVVSGRTLIWPADLPREIVASETTSNVGAGVSSAPAPVSAGHAAANEPSTSVEQLWRRLEAGEDFWTVVHRPFRTHDLTRDDVRRLVARGLAHTRGSYRAVARLFGIPDREYKRFMAFLSQHDCNVSFRPHRMADRAVKSEAPPALAS